MKNIFKLFLALCLSLQVYFADAQVSWLGNDNSAPPGSFVGWDSSVTTDPLRIAHEANQPILFSTNGNQNMEIASYRNVGVGTQGVAIRPKFYSRLTPANASVSPFASMAIFGENAFIGGFTSQNVGVRGMSIGISAPSNLANNIGGSFQSYGAWRNIGVDILISAVGGVPNPGDHGWGIRVVATDHVLSNYAIDARAAHGPNSTIATELVGISAGVDNLIPGNPNQWAGAFQGDVQVWGAVNANGYNLNPSDIQFKTNVESIENALDVINQLSPKKYNFLTEEFSHLNFPEGEQYGVIAQELIEVLPNLVKETRMLTKRDTAGNVIADPIDYLAVNYNGLIPILVAGMKEQQTIINAQNELLAQVLERLDAVEQCCNYDGSRSTPGNSGALPEKMHNEKSIDGGNELYQNIPNPFRESTTISYLLETDGRVQLAIYDGNGKVVTTLVDANQGPGRYSEVWNANGMPSGVYHYALYVNGELLVKRAIKLQE
jgi:hypothetical protein